MILIAFDVDKTLVSIEGLDELIIKKFQDRQAQALLEITENAMNGKIDFNKALKQRLDIIKPSKDDIQYLANLYLSRVSKGAKDMINSLKSCKKYEFAIISGGLHDAIVPLAKELGINIIKAIHLNGTNANIDTFNKCNAIQELMSEYKFEKVYMIGDGVTDLETMSIPNVNITMIGYGQYIVRPKILANANYIVYSFAQLTNILTNCNLK